MPSQNRNILFLFGLVAGGPAGAGLTLLLTPQSGQVTRSQIGAKSFALKNGAMESLTEASQRAQAQVGTWQERGQEVGEAISRGKDSIFRAVSQSKDRVGAAVGSSK